jgi:ribosomal protein L11 methyltransferase
LTPLADYPVLDVRAADSDLALAAVDDCSPAAVEHHGAFFTIYFPDATSRDRAARALASALPGVRVSPREVDDEDWARRSQQNLRPVTVGRITIAPPWAVSRVPLLIVIQPSMGFGTGHHATTRLCVAALQQVPLAGARVLDLGTGSGVLALVARALGAAQVVGIDHDADAIQSARENLTLNPAIDRVEFEVCDLASWLCRLSARDAVRRPDVIVANVTGALLTRSAVRLAQAASARGTLIVSGLMEHERADVLAAFDGAVPSWEAQEDGWIALVLRADSLRPTGS